MRVQLSHLRQSLVRCRVYNPGEAEVTAVTADSRRTGPGSLFIAIRGDRHDGHEFAGEAVARGAVALLVERELPDCPVPQLVVPDTRLAAAIVADRFFGHPSHRLRMIGVTGTNGKTTVTHLIERILLHGRRRTGLIGTVGMRIDGQPVDLATTTPTTPEAVELQAALRAMVDAGMSHCVMEVSSESIERGRVAGTRYQVAVFTNLSQDHLDFHGTMDNYRAAKGKLFSRLGNAFGDGPGTTICGVVNADDPNAAYFRAQTAAECIGYGFGETADVRAVEVRLYADGARFRAVTFAGEADVSMRLTGRFNVSNALAAIAVGLVEGVPLPVIADALAQVERVPGRLERVDAGQPFTVLVDYAHTPDSLEKALETVREFAEGRVLTVVGCGGDRDRTKRPLMAAVAVRLSDVVIFTSDNPRTEDPEQILDDMEAGLNRADKGSRWERITDRRQAIVRAVNLARPGDVLLIAGKGHETYQIVGRTKHHFDDREVARDAIRRRLGLPTA
ncbi:MAG: UDP-N-acetylmuramoyl-L-alanyl-D-glutamate--2,6-diaminopimelate ligase [Alicyclobacillaceae bacterium]|nr:UDP-N-acetylmuramoyl-L-alanyl-D-glutamate--2,6-diaminopimelate ligase [Alicyclobacillaceae bacterium]